MALFKDDIEGRRGLGRLFGLKGGKKAGADSRGGDFVADYKAAMRLNAGAVAVITTAAGDRVGGITSTSFNSLSVEPPSIFFGLGNDANAYDLFFESGMFALNILGEGQADIARMFADQTRRNRRFKDAPWSRTAGGPPIIEGDTAAVFECRIEQHLRAHTHTIVVGLVERVRIGRARPLIYLNGGYVRAEALK